MPAPSPTRINALFIDGAIYHWDRITEAQALALGVTALPAQHSRAVARSGPWTTRRLADGNLNVTCAGARPRTVDAGYRSFMCKVLEPVPRPGEPGSSDFAPLQGGGP